MSRIQLTNLQSAGSNLFQGSESFLTELQSTEAHAVYGGSGKNKKNTRGNGGNGGNNNGNNYFVYYGGGGHGGGCGCP